MSRAAWALRTSESWVSVWRPMRTIEVVSLTGRAEDSGIARLAMFLARSPMRSSVEAIFIAAIRPRRSPATGWRSAIRRTTLSSSATSMLSSARSRSITARARLASRSCTDCSALASSSSQIPPISEMRA